MRSPILIGAGSEREAAQRIAVARIIVGGTVLVTTGIAQRIFAIPADLDTPGLRMVARLFGIRNVVLGAWALKVQGEPGDTRRFCYQLNAAVDAADLAILGLGAASGTGLMRSAIVGGALGGSALAAWLELAGMVVSPERGPDRGPERGAERGRERGAERGPDAGSENEQAGQE